jgi:hypothetical protein
MIKFVAVLNPKTPPDAQPELLLGVILSHANLDELRKGRPILFEFAEVNVNMPDGIDGFPAGKVMIAADETEEAVLDQFRQRGVQIGELLDHKTPYEAEQWLNRQQREP